MKPEIQEALESVAYGATKKPGRLRLWGDPELATASTHEVSHTKRIIIRFLENVNPELTANEILEELNE